MRKLVLYTLTGTKNRRLKPGNIAKIRYLFQFYTIKPTDTKKGKFENGLKTGEWKSWFENGEVQSISHWRSGQQEGLFSEFDRPGKPVRTGRFKRGQLKGVCRSWEKTL